jgi:hypothetical protein
MMRHKRFTESRDLLREAGPHLLAAVAGEPTHRRAGLFYRNNRHLLTTACRHLGDAEAAVAAVREMMAHATYPADWFFHAQILGWAAGRLGAGETAQAEAYAVEALAALREAVNQGFRDPAPYRTSPDLDPFRERADFKDLLKSLSPPTPPVAPGNSR